MNYFLSRTLAGAFGGVRDSVTRYARQSLIVEPGSSSVVRICRSRIALSLFGDREMVTNVPELPLAHRGSPRPDSAVLIKGWVDGGMLVVSGGGQT